MVTAAFVLLALAAVGALITLETDSVVAGAITLVLCVAALGCVYQAEANRPPQTITITIHH